MCTRVVVPPFFFCPTGFQIIYLYVLITKLSMPDFIQVISIIVYMLKVWPPIRLNHPFSKSRDCVRKGQ